MITKSSYIVSVAAAALLGVASTCLAATKTDPNATAATQALYANLEALEQSDFTAFGQQFGTWQGIEASGTSWTWLNNADRSDIKTVAVDHPAVTGWNIQTYLDAGLVPDPATQDAFVLRVKEDYARNTIITFHWTMNNLITNGDDRDRTGWNGYPNIGDPTILARAVTSGEPANIALLGYLDDFADLLALLTVDGVPIPIIFRPFHEMHGDAQWWTNGDEAEYATFWNYVLTYLRDTKGIHNLLYAYAPGGGKMNSNTETEYLRYWPGDTSVDVCGMDLYGGNYHAYMLTTANVADSKGMVAAFTEIGPGTGKGLNGVSNSTTWWTANVLTDFKDYDNGYANPLWTKCAYMMTWTNKSTNNYFVPYHSEHSQAADFVDFMRDPHVLLQPDLPPMYTTAPQSATVTLSNLSQTYNGSPRPVTVTTDPAGLSHATTYDSSATVPTNAGSYAVVAAIDDPGYTGSASGTLLVAQAAATVTLGGLAHTYDGTAKSATATTSPGGLAVTFTYDGSSTPPSAVGSYTVVGTIGDPNYAGSATGTMTISGGPTTVTFYSTSAYDGWVRESSATSGNGGTVTVADSGVAALRAGDDSGNKQYKAFVSFDTNSIPEGVTITAVTLRLKRGTVMGTNPFSDPGTYGTCRVDIVGGYGFGGALTLASGDFQYTTEVVANVVPDGMSAPAANGDWSTGTLTTGLSTVNTGGSTQLRIYFSADAPNNNNGDYIGWYSGEAAAGDKPELVVTYQ